MEAPFRRSLAANAVVLLLCFASGCGLARRVAGGNPDQIAERNRKRLSELKIGMAREEVLEVFGKDPPMAMVNSPYREESVGTDGGELRVMYFYTDSRPGSGVTDDELTPVVLRDGVVVGWGRRFFEQEVKRIEVRAR